MSGSDALVLVAWLKDQITEDERIALAVSDGPHKPERWTANRYKVDSRGWRVDGQHSCVVDGAFGPDAAHIALHDPARVLREVAAKRRLMAEHRTPAERWPDDPMVRGDRSCVGCGFNSVEERMVEDIGECPVLLALVSVYSDRPGFQDSWRIREDERGRTVPEVAPE